MTWRVAQSLEQLLAEINHAAPDRSKVSDGSIGDPAHASTDSDHNPSNWPPSWSGVVRARDFTDDPLHGCDAARIAEQVRRLGLEGRHPALGPGAYVIWNRQIASDTYGWTWRPYSGSNPHNHHVHVSVATAAAGYDSTAPWGVTEEEDMNREQDARLERVENKLDRLDDVLRVKLTRTNTRLQRAHERLLKLITIGRATRADLEDLAADLADEEEGDTP